MNSDDTKRRTSRRFLWAVVLVQYTYTSPLASATSRLGKNVIRFSGSGGIPQRNRNICWRGDKLEIPEHHWQQGFYVVNRDIQTDMHHDTPLYLPSIHDGCGDSPRMRRIGRDPLNPGFKSHLHFLQPIQLPTPLNTYCLYPSSTLHNTDVFLLQLIKYRYRPTLRMQLLARLFTCGASTNRTSLNWWTF